MAGYHGGSHQDGDSNDVSLDNASGYGDGSETMDFLSQAPPYAGSGAHTGFRNNSGDVFGSNAPSLSHLGFSELDLNASHSWPGLARYQEILQSPAEDGGSGSAHGPLPCACHPAPAGVPSASDLLAAACLPWGLMVMRQAARLAVPGGPVCVAA